MASCSPVSHTISHWFETIDFTSLRMEFIVNSEFTMISESISPDKPGDLHFLGLNLDGVMGRGATFALFIRSTPVWLAVNGYCGLIGSLFFPLSSSLFSATSLPIVGCYKGRILHLTLLLMVGPIRQLYYWSLSRRRQLLQQEPALGWARINHLHTRWIYTTSFCDTETPRENSLDGGLQIGAGGWNRPVSFPSEASSSDTGVVVAGLTLCGRFISSGLLTFWQFAQGSSPSETTERGGIRNRKWVKVRLIPHTHTPLPSNVSLSCVQALYHLWLVWMCSFVSLLTEDDLGLLFSTTETQTLAVTKSSSAVIKATGLM